MSLKPLPPASMPLYNKAPAVEVMYTIRTALPSPVDVHRFVDVIEEAFPGTFKEYQEFKTFQGAVMLKQDGSADSNVQMGAAGYRCLSADKAFAAHYLLQGLSLNFLPPYSGYAAAMDRLRQHWEVYKRVVGEVQIAALTLRYIDRIDIPQPEGNVLDLDKYFTIVSKLPDGLSAHQCYQQYWLNDGTGEIRARVIWSSLENKPGYISFALDTEAMLDPANISNENEAWKRFDDLHGWCWHVFDHSLTDTCKALFK